MTTDTRLSLIVGQNAYAREIAVSKIPGQGMGLIWLGGYRSDMTGTKAQVMMEWAENFGYSALCFDYSGHGVSGGEFRDGTISCWLEEALAVFEQFSNGPQILVGSSMGGWVALRLTQELQKRGELERLAGILLIAPAPDFTKELMELRFSDDQMEELEINGFISEPSQYSNEPNIITRNLISDGRNNLVLDGIITTECPVIILQGMADPDVPYQHVLKLLNHLPSDDVTLTLIKDGDHRLSRDQDLELMRQALKRLASKTQN